MELSPSSRAALGERLILSAYGRGDIKRIAKRLEELSEADSCADIPTEEVIEEAPRATIVRKSPKTNGNDSANLLEGETLERLRKLARQVEAESLADPGPDIPAEKVLARLRKKYP